MTVGELRKALEDVPDDWPVLIPQPCGQEDRCGEDDELRDADAHHEAVWLR